MPRRGFQADSTPKSSHLGEQIRVVQALGGEALLQRPYRPPEALCERRSTLLSPSMTSCAMLRRRRVDLVVLSIGDLRAANRRSAA